MKKLCLLLLLTLLFPFLLVSQTATYSRINFVKTDGSSNGDATYFFRDDQVNDRTYLKLRMGDETSSDFEIGYIYYSDGQWYCTFKLDGNGNGSFFGNQIQLKNKGDAILRLEADTDNVTESDNPAIHMLQDKGGVQSSIGLCETGKDAIGRGLTNCYSGGNHFTINAIYQYSGIQFAIGDDVKAYISNSGQLISNYGITSKGLIKATEIKVEAQTADFVFEDNYRLRSLEETEAFITENKHLPDVPSAAEMEEQGVNLAEMNKLLLQKVEELTLYAIQKEKEVRDLKANEAKMEAKINEIEVLLHNLLNDN